MRSLALSVPLAIALSACGNGAPELPPDESMTVDFSDFNDSGALVDPAKKDAFTNAALRVGVLNLSVGLGLAAPVLVFKAARLQQAKRDGDGWTWSYQQGTATATLHARVDGVTVTWEMRINGKVGADEYTDFLWYTGAHQPGSGNWEFHSKDAKTVRIDWKVTDAEHRTLDFTNVTAGADDWKTLSYKLDGDAAGVAYHTTDVKEATIAWSRSAKTGSMTAGDFAGHENEQVCWDATRHDAECPAQ